MSHVPHNMAIVAMRLKKAILSAKKITLKLKISPKVFSIEFII
jgi:hypothetical protein